MTRTNIITITLILAIACIAFTAGAANNVYLLHIMGPDSYDVNHVEGAYKYGWGAILTGALFMAWTFYLGFRAQRS